MKNRNKSASLTNVNRNCIIGPVDFKARQNEMKTLEESRRIINEIDRKMAHLFQERMEAVREIAAFKQEHDLSVFDPEREQTVLNRNIGEYPDDGTRDLYVAFLQNTMDLSKQYQHRLII